MADETEDTLDDRLERIQRRAETFSELLKEGEEVVIACADGAMHVEESYRSKFERKHPKLFGRMLSIEAQIETGWFPYFVAVMLAGGFTFGLQMNWWADAFGEAACTLLDNWWFQVALLAILLYLAHLACGFWQTFVYRRNRAELLKLIVADQLDRDVLLVMLRDEGDLDVVVKQLKLDTVQN